jgi:hypothetical protein
VLVTGAVVALIATTLLRLAMMRYQVTTHAQMSTIGRREAEGALARVVTAWNAANQNCVGVSGFSVKSGSPGSCNCELDSTSTSKYPKVFASMNGSQCELKIISSNPFP